jgi:hypothetical protein
MSQLPEHLFNLPEYSSNTTDFMTTTINDLMRRKDGVLNQLRVHDVSDLPRSQVTTSSGEVVKSESIVCQMEFSIALSDSVAGNLPGFVTSLDEAAESGLQSLMPQIFNAFGQVCAATGNIIDASSEGLTHDTFLQMLESLDIHFDEDGSHNLSWVMDPTTFDKLSKLPQPTEQQNRKVEELLERKRREFYGRKRQRRLAGQTQNLDYHPNDEKTS